MPYNPFSLEGKTILVTGASSGIGRQTCIEASKLGATVVLTGRNESELQKTLSLMESEGHQILPADLTNDEDIASLVAGLPEIDGFVWFTGYIRIRYNSTAAGE